MLSGGLLSLRCGTSSLLSHDGQRDHSPHEAGIWHQRQGVQGVLRGFFVRHALCCGRFHVGTRHAPDARSSSNGSPAHQARGRRRSSWVRSSMTLPTRSQRTSRSRKSSSIRRARVPDGGHPVRVAGGAPLAEARDVRPPRAGHERRSMRGEAPRRGEALGPRRADDERAGAAAGGAPACAHLWTHAQRASLISWGR